jgi:hypothetical protein
MIDGEADGFAALYTHNGVIVGATFVAALPDNCLLSLMPSAGRTHKKLKKKLTLVVALPTGAAGKLGLDGAGGSTDAARSFV